MYDAPTADAVRAVREQFRIANKIELAKWLERVEQDEQAEALFREVAKDLGVVLS